MLLTWAGLLLLLEQMQAATLATCLKGVDSGSGLHLCVLMELLLDIVECADQGFWQMLYDCILCLPDMLVIL